MPDAVIIGQDEETEIHVQALLQSGRRHVDIRVWRRGPSGFAPSRSGLTLGPSDLDALQEGVRDLLRASNGGTEVARVVWDGNEGRRLRAEIAPFGTRHIARLGFWQRVRSTWRAADDGLVITADRLTPLQHTLNRFRPWFSAAIAEEEHQQTAERTREALGRWPSPGGDWLTIEGDRAAFHPRGVRITAALTEADGEHRVRLQQWRRDESLWLREPGSLEVTATTIEAILAALETIEDVRVRGETAEHDVSAVEGPVCIRLDGSGMLVVARPSAPEPSAEPPVPILTFPAAYLLRFGRFLLQSWSLLLERLTEEEWTALEAAPFILAEHLHEPEAPAGCPELEHEHEPNRSELLAETKTVVPPEPAEPVLAAVVAELPEPPVPEPEPEPPLELEPPTRLGEAMVGENRVTFSLQRNEENALFLLRWGNRALALPADLTDELVSGLRTLYYDSLLGRRHTLSLGEAGIRAGMHNQGMRVCLVVEANREGERTSLSIPGVEVPTFLNAVEAALASLTPALPV